MSSFVEILLNIFNLNSPIPDNTEAYSFKNLLSLMTEVVLDYLTKYLQLLTISTA
jgi:hypothetical protein